MGDVTAKSKNSALNVNLINFSNNLACLSDYVGYSSIGTTIQERLGHACTSAVLGRKTLAPAPVCHSGVSPRADRRVRASPLATRGRRSSTLQHAVSRRPSWSLQFTLEGHHEVTPLSHGLCGGLAFL